MNWIAEVKSKLNIVDIIEAEGIVSKVEGAHSFSALCPFHNERTPSFKFSEQHQNFRCFGCGKAGDVLTFYAERHSISRVEAAEHFALELGIKTEDSDKFKKHNRQLEICKHAEAFFKDNFNKLPESHPAKQEILNRNLVITDDFGFAPDSPYALINHLTSKGFSTEELKEIGFISEKNNVQQRNRLIFFIRNYMGNTIGFTGRALGKDVDGFKYVNSKTSEVYNKSHVLYNIENAKNMSRKKEFIFVAEGQFDVIAMKQKGFENTIAASGTAISKQQISEIKRAIGEKGRIILILDGDAAGKKAMDSVFKTYPELHGSLYIITLPEGQDPCDYLKNNVRLPKAEEYIGERYREIQKRHNLSTPDDRANFLKEIEQEIVKFIKKPILKNEYLKQAYSTIGVQYKGGFKAEKPKVVNSSKISPVDLLYISSLATYVNNPNIIKINTSDYPEKYHEIVLELINVDKTARVIPELFSKPKLAEVILDKSMENSSVREGSEYSKEDIVTYYNTLMRRAKKL